MKTRATRAALGLWLCFLLAACGGGGRGSSQGDSAPVRVYEEDDAVWVARGDSQQMLADDGMGYAWHVSGDGRFIAVDVAILSTVQVTRLFARGADGRYGPAENLSSRAWDTVVASRDGLSIDDIERPRTRFVGWSEGGGVRVEVSGDAPDGVEILEQLVLSVD